MSIKIHQQDSPQIALFAKLQTTVSTLKSLHQKSTQEQTDNIALQQITLAKINSKHKLQMQALKDQLNSRNAYVKELELQQKTQESTLMTNFKFQLNQLEQMICERETENESLHKQILRQKQKITQLEAQIQSERQGREFYENSCKKLLETVRSQMREIHSTNDENELTRFMSSTAYRQFIERMEVVGGLGTEQDMKKNCMRERYMRLKTDHLRLVERNNWLEIEKERLCERLWEIENGCSGHGGEKNNLTSKGNDIITIGMELKQVRQTKRSKYSISLKSKPHDPTTNFPFNGSYNNGSSKCSKLPNLSQTLLLQRIEQTFNIVSKHASELQGIGENLSNINKKITQDQETWSQIMMVKQANTKLKDELNELRERKVNPLIGDEIMKAGHPSLFTFFSSKMQQLQQFENRLETLQTQSAHIIQLIERILYQGLPIHNPPEPTPKQLHQQQTLIRSKVKKQLTTKFQSQKQLLKQQIESFYEDKIIALNQEIIKLTKETSRLTAKNQDMFKLLNEMEEREQQIILQAEEQQKQQSIMLSTNKKQQPHQSQQQIQPKLLSPKSQIDKQLLAYLQKKTDDLEVLLEEEKKLTQKYKKELKLTLQTYKVKNTKLKTCRCNECLLTIIDEKNEAKKCEKCKLDLHLLTCYKQHQNNCKRRQTGKGNPISSNNNKTTKNNPQQKKRTSNQLANSIVSENMDYF